MLADITHCLVRHIDVYQENNAGKFDIHSRVANLLTTVKVVVNVIITVGVVNDPNGAREMFLDNLHAFPEILAILEEELSVLAGGICWKNRKGFPLK